MTALFSLPGNRARAGPIRTSSKRYSVRRRWLAFRVSSVLVMLFEIEKNWAACCLESYLQNWLIENVS
jgi:hypothetical protein